MLPRKMSFSYHVDLHTLVKGGLSVRGVHYIAHEVENTVLHPIPQRSERLDTRNPKSHEKTNVSNSYKTADRFINSLRLGSLSMPSSHEQQSAVRSCTSLRTCDLVRSSLYPCESVTRFAVPS